MRRATEIGGRTLPTRLTFESSLFRSLFLLFQPIDLSHGWVVVFVVDLDGVGIVDDAVENGVGESRFPDFTMPAGRSEL